MSRAISPTDTRRSALGALRRRLRECDAPTVEHVIAELLERMGMRELKVAKRGRDHVVYTARKRLGLGELRHCVRILRGGGEVGRREVVEVRRDVGNYGAQIGMIVSAGEAARDARGEATAPGQMPVVLLCGDALVESMTELSVGCRPVVIPEVDEAFFKGAAEAALTEEAARRSRREERERRDREARSEREVSVEAAGPGESAEAAVIEPVSGAPGAAGSPIVLAGATTAEREASEVDEGDDEGDEEVECEAPAVAAQGAAGPEEERQGEVRRRRRRRRRRGGRGRGRETSEEPAAEGASAASASGVTPGAAPPEQAPVAAQPPAGPPTPAAEPAAGDAPGRADGGQG